MIERMKKIMNIDDRVEFLKYEHKGKQGTVIDVFQNVIITVRLDDFPFPVTTMITNLNGLKNN